MCYRYICQSRHNICSSINTPIDITRTTTCTSHPFIYAISSTNLSREQYWHSINSKTYQENKHLLLKIMFKVIASFLMLHENESSEARSSPSHEINLVRMYAA
ncbi:hypothetical protein RF11_14560 [Thelohanellus kitauei]|uniref:Uncharacterized protein n=1 Tax=Thelohanellus kitauei TaxID=669202 RepID=A0A0C2J4G5_THEKT|nr:hypothetical protein RF11_14560 [Thelohanellus kitauei]